MYLVISRKAGYSAGGAVSGSEFDASHFVPDAPNAFTNDGFLQDNGNADLNCSIDYGIRLE